MRTTRILFLSAALILTTGTITHASDASDMSINELIEGYQALQEENQELKEQIASLQEQLSDLQGTAAEEQPSEQDTTSSDKPKPATDPDQPLFEQTDITCMIYGAGEDRRYEMVVELLNISDEPLYLNAKSFDLEDTNGHLLQTDNMIGTAPDVILPGERGYLYNPLGTRIDVDTPNEDIVFIPQYSVKKATAVPHDYPYSDISFKTDAYGDYTMVGRVENDTNEDMDVYATVVYYDTNGKCMGVTGTTIFDVGVGETQGFEISSFGLQNTFDPNAIGSYTLYMREHHIQF